MANEPDNDRVAQVLAKVFALCFLAIVVILVVAFVIGPHSHSVAPQPEYRAS